MQAHKKPSRSFNEVSHFFLSSEESSNKESKENKYDSKLIIENVSKLEVLKNSCLGIELRNGQVNMNAAWFQGAYALLQDVVNSLSETLKPSEDNIEND